MALTYLRIRQQLGALLQIIRKRGALLEHALRANDADFDRRLLTRANGFDLTNTNEARAHGALVAELDGNQGPGVRALHEAWRVAVEDLESWFGVVATDLGLSEVDRAAGAITYEYAITDGKVTILKRNGVLGALRRDMELQGESVLENTITPGALTPDSGNLGLLAFDATPTFESHAIPGIYVLEVESEDVTSPTFTLVNQFTNLLPNGDSVRNSDNPHTVERDFQDGPLAILLLKLVRTKLTSPDKLGDGGSMFTGVVTVTTPKTGDMAGGILQVRVTRTGTTSLLVEYFSDAARTNRVGSTVFTDVVGTAPISETLSNGTGFAETLFDKAAAAVELPVVGNIDDDITFNIRTPKLNDKFRFTVANDNAGNFSSKIKDVWPVSLKTIAAAPTFPESAAASISMS